MMLSNMELLATAPGGMTRLRELILTLAVQGKLVPQDLADEPASVLLQKIRTEKDRLIADGKIKRDKPLREVAQEETPFELPVGWEWVKGRDLFTVVRGVTYQKSDAKAASAEGLLPILRANNIRGSINFDDLIYVPASLISKDQLLRSGDYVVCLASGSKNLVGKAAPFRPEVTCSFAFCGAIRPITDAAYFAVYLASPMYRESVSEASAGIGINNLKGSSLLDLDIALPPLAEQSRIVTRVEALMRLCGALEAKGRLEAAQHAQLVSTLLGTLTASTTPEELAANWQRVSQHFDLLLDRPEAIDALEQTLLQLAVRGLLVPQDPTDEPASVLLQKIRAEKDRLIAERQIKRDKPLPPITDEEKPFELPVGWEWVRLGALANFIDYRGKTPIKTPSGVSLITAKNVRRGFINRAPHEFIAESAYDRWMTRGVPKVGDLLFTTEAPLGNVAAIDIDERFALAQRVICFGLFELGMSGLLLTFLQSPWFQGVLETQASGVTAQGIKSSRLQLLHVPVPPIPEQSRIVIRVTALRRLCADLRQRLAERQSVQARLAETLVQEMA